MNTKNLIRLQSCATIIIAFCLISQSLLKFVYGHIPHHISNDALPYAPTLQTGIIHTVIGFLLLYFVVFLYRRRIVAYYFILTLLATSIAVSLSLRHLSVYVVLGMVCLMTSLLLARNQYTVKSDQVRLRKGVTYAVFVTIAALLYGMVGFLFAGERVFHQTYLLTDAFVQSIRAILTFQDLDGPTMQARLFIHSLDILGFAVYVLIFSSLFNPVRFIFRTGRRDIETARNILSQHSTSSEDYFKLWPGDKHYFFSNDKTSFIAYKTAGATAFVLGDPVGSSDELSTLSMDFYQFITRNGWRCVVINGSDSIQSRFKDAGLNTLFIGNEAIIDIDEYLSTTTHEKHMRYVKNKAAREGLTAEYWQDISDSQMAQLRRVSDAWLAHGGRKEYTFFMGYFNQTYLRAGGVMVLKQHDQVVAYISLLQTFIDSDASIDQFRATPTAPSVSMYYLLGETIRHLDSQGKKTVNIGLAPLSGVEETKSRASTITEIFKVIKKVGRRYYSFDGVEQFKNKQRPIWHPKYVYYSGGLTALPAIARDFDQATRYGYTSSRKRYVTVYATAVAAILIVLQFI